MEKVPRACGHPCCSSRAEGCRQNTLAEDGPPAAADRPTDDLRLHAVFYGPYSAGVQAEIGLLDKLGLVSEEARAAKEGAPYYLLQAVPEAVSERIVPYRKYIDQLSR